jgi:hypothetical protein
MATIRPVRARIMLRRTALARRVKDQKFTCMAASALSCAIMAASTS